MWTMAVFGAALPYASQNLVDIATVATSLTWVIGNEMYIKGYSAENPGGRAPGFKIRTFAFRFWMYGSLLAVTCFAVRHFGIYELP